MGRDAGAFGAKLKALRETAGYTQEELATIAGLSVHAVSALERGERRRPHVDTVRALSSALDLTGPTRDALLGSARAPARATAVEELGGVTLPQPLTGLLGRDADVETLRRWLADPDARTTPESSASLTRRIRGGAATCPPLHQGLTSPSPYGDPVLHLGLIEESDQHRVVPVDRRLEDQRREIVRARVDRL